MDNKNFELYRKYLSFIQIRTLSLVIHLWHNLLININYYEYRLRSSTEIIVSILPLTTSVLFNCCEHFPDNILCSPSDAGIGKIPLFSFQFWHFVFHLDLLQFQCLQIQKWVWKILYQFNLSNFTDLGSIWLWLSQQPQYRWPQLWLEITKFEPKYFSRPALKPSVCHKHSGSTKQPPPPLFEIPYVNLVIRVDNLFLR